MALNDVPQPGQTLALTQPLIRNNFSTIDSAFSVDHVSYNLGGAGKHNKVTFPVQSSTPTFPGDIGLYNKVDPTTMVSQLYFTTSTGTTYPMTASARQSFTSGGNGYSYLPSGLVVQWGRGVALANQVTQVNLNFNYSNGIMSVQVTQFVNSDGFVFVNTSPQLMVLSSFNTIGNTNFMVNNNGAQVEFMWFAIGL